MKTIIKRKNQMSRVITAIITIIYLSSCSNTVDVDTSSAILGAWECDDEIIITFTADGRYDWRVPYDEGFEIGFKDNDSIRRNDDGGYSILDKWRLSGNQLEMDMWGEADKYTLKFKSDTEVQLIGIEKFTCNKN